MKEKMLSEEGKNKNNDKHQGRKENDITKTY